MDVPDADWGPLAGPWKRYAGNPILPEPGASPGPGSIIPYDGRWWMFIYNNNGHNTRLAVSEDGYEWRYVHDRPILTAENRWEVAPVLFGQSTRRLSSGIGNTGVTAPRSDTPIG